ncbi:MAG: DUF2125 domain-containing protein [Pseudomonadota bacterium]
MPPRLRRILLIAAIAAAVLAAGWIGWWYVAAGRFADAIDGWIAARRAEGYHVEASRIRVSGFPLRLKTSVASPEATAPDGSWFWSGPDIALAAPAWAPLRIAFTFPGLHSLTLKDKRYEALTARADGRLDLARDGRIDRLTLDIAEVSAREAGRTATTIRSLLLVASEPRGDGAGPMPTALAFDLAANDIALPPDRPAPLGSAIDEIQLAGRLEGPAPTGTDAAALSLWRDAGGAIDLDHITLSWGPLHLSGNATFALDPSLRPLAAASTEIEGAPEAIAALADARLIDPQNAQLAVLGLAALADGEGKVKLPLTAQDGALWAGPIRLADLPPLAGP